jgi:hypothetical protein
MDKIKKSTYFKVWLLIFFTYTSSVFNTLKIDVLSRNITNSDTFSVSTKIKQIFILKNECLPLKAEQKIDSHKNNSYIQSGAFAAPGFISTKIEIHKNLLNFFEIKSEINQFFKKLIFPYHTFW